MRNVLNWQPYTQATLPTLLFGRGYTGHEQLNDFGLINMNARLYDPLLGRFLAPDPFVGSGLSNDFNRYVYARNNPLMYTDPSGKSFKDWWKKNVSEPFMRELNERFGNGQGGWELGYNSSGGFFSNPTYNGKAFGPSAYYNTSNKQFSIGNGSVGFHDNITSVNNKPDPVYSQMSQAVQSYLQVEAYRQSTQGQSLYSNPSTYIGGTGAIGDISSFGAQNGNRIKYYGNIASGIGSIYSLSNGLMDLRSLFRPSIMKICSQWIAQV